MHLRRANGFLVAALLFILIACPPAALADGKVFRDIFAQKIETPNQEALISFDEGIERLVIETSVLGPGTNFAWVLPLPAPPEIKAVSEGFFTNLRHGFRSELVHDVNPYYAGALLLCGLFFLGWRSLTDEGLFAADVPLCVALGGLAWFATKSTIAGILAVGLAAYVRLFTHSNANFGLAMFVSAVFAACVTFMPDVRFELIDTLGQESDNDTKANGVTVVSVQHAGIFESTTIHATNPRDVLDWLARNGYHVPAGAEEPIRYYIDHGWVFVASKVRRGTADAELTSLPPLAFTFATKSPVYPMRLTGVENGNCEINLYVFATHKALAANFAVTRCDKLGRLRLTDPEIRESIGAATVGTKLTATLKPAQMASDVSIDFKRFSAQGATVYSQRGATMVALNIAVPLAAIAWLLLGASRGGWNVKEKTIWLWRCQAVVLSVVLGLSIYAFLPKVEVVRVPRYNDYGGF
jgi:hypothetical protein